MLNLIEKILTKKNKIKKINKNYIINKENNLYNIIVKLQNIDSIIDLY